MEWAENDYHHLRIARQTAALVPVGPFWRDYARHAGDGPFLSRHLADASRNFTEAMLALAVLDLPFEPARHQLAFAGGRMTLGPAGPMVAFHEEVRRTDGPDGTAPVLVGQSFYRPADRFREENGEKVDKYVTGEFLAAAAPYGCRVVATNPTSGRQRLSLLVQVPVGAVPLGDGRPTRTVTLDLEPYHTQTVDYLFYFPRPGRFTHFPAHAAKSGRVVAAARPTAFDVFERPTRRDAESWDCLSQFGTADEVVALLNRENVSALNLDKIAFRMTDKAVLDRVLALLTARHVYSPTLWSDGVFHNDPAGHAGVPGPRRVARGRVRRPARQPAFDVDPVERFACGHLEYKPLVNARAHGLGPAACVICANRLHTVRHGTGPTSGLWNNPSASPRSRGGGRPVRVHQAGHHGRPSSVPSSARGKRPGRMSSVSGAARTAAAGTACRASMRTSAAVTTAPGGRPRTARRTAPSAPCQSRRAGPPSCVPAGGADRSAMGGSSAT